MRAEQVERRLTQVVAAGGAPNGKNELAYIAEQLDEWERSLAEAPPTADRSSQWVADWRNVMLGG